VACKINSLALFFGFLANFSIMAMVPTGTVEQHVALAYESPHNEAATLIFDKDLGFTQSGVLVRKNIVLTAAHGMQLLLNAKYPVKDLGAYVLITPKALYATFSPNIHTKITYKVESVLLDSRYIRFEMGDQHKYDIAILRLSKSVDGIDPIDIADELTFEADIPMLVHTWGNSDMPSKHIKRGFYLYEWSLYFPNRDEDPLANYRTVMLSSLFFEPADVLPQKPDINAAESVQRRYFALKSWSRFKRPYGLALPGTSGAPVYIEMNSMGRCCLHFFGLIMGYADLGEEVLLLSKDSEALARNPHKAYNKYQTIITTPFRLDMRPTVNNSQPKHFMVDKRYLQMIDGLASGSIH